MNTVLKTALAACLVAGSVTAACAKPGAPKLPQTGEGVALKLGGDNAGFYRMNQAEPQPASKATASQAAVIAAASKTTKPQSAPTAQADHSPAAQVKVESMPSSHNAYEQVQTKAQAHFSDVKQPQAKANAQTSPAQSLKQPQGEPTLMDKLNTWWNKESNCEKVAGRFNKCS